MPVAKGTGIAPDLEWPTGSPAGALAAPARAHPPRRAKGPRPERACGGGRGGGFGRSRFRTGLERRLRFSLAVRRFGQAGFAPVARAAKRVAAEASAFRLRSGGGGSEFASIARLRNGSPRGLRFSMRSGGGGIGFARCRGCETGCGGGLGFRLRSGGAGIGVRLDARVAKAVHAAGLPAAGAPAARIGRFGVGCGPTEGEGATLRRAAEPGDGDRRGLRRSFEPASSGRKAVREHRGASRKRETGNQASALPRPAGNRPGLHGLDGTHGDRRRHPPSRGAHPPSG